VRAALLGGGVAAAAYWGGTLTLDGALAAASVGAVVFARGGRRGAAALLAFFVTSSALSRMREQRRSAGLAQAKGGRRDAAQVLANGGAATLSLLLGHDGGFVSGLAAAAADTWATEVGLLIGQRPRLITSWQFVEPGRSGGVTLAGLLASVGGAATVGLTWWLAGGSARALPLAMLSGAFGSVLDSVLGATLQALSQCPGCGAWSERAWCAACGRRTQRVRGLAAVTNDSVNALATVAAAMLGEWLSRRRRCPT
jgi:uncharacterized protein (TIGR00297 family)